MTHPKMTLVDWLDDLCVRFIVNLPNEELQSVERICFQIEEAQWFYEDFIRPLDPSSLPSMHLRKFSQLMFQHCPLFSAYSEELHQQAYEQFLAYKTRVPVRGAIMLNQDMTHAVLVKGWKKGAKWSFPRGKINKEEPDLDCAVREVWEETGYDLHEANLVLPDEDMKKITVTMREQSMMLYVFRGVPMDTYFEPRTRKEISKIDWYKLTDLPMLRRKNQTQPQGVGQDLIKESSFYMVAPFLGPLRAWIKQQHKLDKQRARTGPHLAPPITDDEELQVETHEPTPDTAHPVLPLQQDDSSFAHLVARLGHRTSDALPEVSDHAQPAQPVDPAAELKRLLSVGMGTQPPPVEAPSMPATNQQPQPNPLLALFHQGDNSQPMSPHHSLPRTPFDQVMPPPVQPPSPHGQHGPRPLQMHNMPPPSFPFSPQQRMQFSGPQPQFNNGMNMNQQQQQPPPQFVPPQHYQNNNQMFQSPPPMSSQQGPRPFQQSHEIHAMQSQSFSPPQSQSFGSHGAGPAIPPASKLPVPKLNAHTMSLLNSFKLNNQQHPAPESSQPRVQAPSPQMAPPLQQHHVPRHQPNELSSPHFQSPPIHVQPVQPKPRSAHQDAMLSLFRGTPPVSSPTPEPAELSALPHTPAYSSAQRAQKAAQPSNMSLLDMFKSQPKPPASITSATVRGPVNAPDFDTMRKNTQPASGSSRGPSPGTLVPQQILRREQSVPRGPSSMKNGGQNAAASPNRVEVSGQSQSDFKPQILKRPQQASASASLPAPTAHTKGLLDMFKQPSSQPPAAQPAVPTTQSSAPTAHAQGLLNMLKGPSIQPPATQVAVPSRQSPAPTAHAQGLLNMFKGPSSQPPMPASQSPAQLPAPQPVDRQESFPPDQKKALLSLFGKPSTKPASPQMPASLQQTYSPVPTGRSPLPPTPQTVMSGVTSPVSPLPEKGSQAVSPADVASRSRISSIGDAASAPSIVIPPMSHTIGVEHAQGRGSVSGLGEASRSGKDGKSPVDKTFLLGFLEDVARRGR
ncbi:mRNA-decapping enzyme subunit 2 [Pleosporales sp. CAS-2024a]